MAADRAGKVWFITGTSSGFGRHWTQSALRRGDRVAVTARALSSLEPLVEEYGELILPLRLDITDRVAAASAISQAAEHFGLLDLVVNNAGFGLFGAIEQITEEQAPGADRDQPAGHAVSHPGRGGRDARAGLRSHCAALVGWWRERVPDDGPVSRIQVGHRRLQSGAGGGVDVRRQCVTLVELFMFPTNFGSTRRSARMRCRPRTRFGNAFYAGFSAYAPGNAEDTSRAILALVGSDNPPLWLLLGAGALEVMTTEHEQRLTTWQRGEEFACPRVAKPALSSRR
jgi:hypothetical protein